MNSIIDRKQAVLLSDVQRCLIANDGLDALVEGVGGPTPPASAEAGVSTLGETQEDGKLLHANQPAEHASGQDTLKVLRIELLTALYPGDRDL